MGVTLTLTQTLASYHTHCVHKTWPCAQFGESDESSGKDLIYDT